MIKEIQTKGNVHLKKNEEANLKTVKNYQMMFLHPKVQVEPYSPNFVVLMHQLLSSRQP
jgi:hypothetical protein